MVVKKFERRELGLFLGHYVIVNHILRNLSVFSSQKQGSGIFFVVFATFNLVIISTRESFVHQVFEESFQVFTNISRK